MHKPYRLKTILGVSVLSTAILLAGCTDNVEKLNNENVVKIGQSSYSMDKVKKDAEIDSTGKLSVSEGLLSKVLIHYYKDKIDEKAVDEAVENYKKSIEKTSKQKISDATEKEIERTVQKSFLVQQAQTDLIPLDANDIEKEYKKGYHLVRVLYAIENGLGSKESKKELESFKAEIQKAKTPKQMQKVAIKYSKSSLITSGTLVVSKDVSNFDEEVTKQVLKGKKGEFVEWKSKDSTGTKNLAFITDSWKASTAEVMMYKKATYIKNKLPNNYALLKALDEKYDDLKIKDSLYKLLKKEADGKTITKDTATKKAVQEGDK